MISLFFVRKLYFVPTTCCLSLIDFYKWELNSTGLFLCQQQDDPPVWKIEWDRNCGAQPETHLVVHQRPLGISSLLSLFLLFLFAISKRQTLLKDSCQWTLGSLKNDPLQSCFFHPHNEIQYSWNGFFSARPLISAKDVCLLVYLHYVCSDLLGSHRLMVSLKEHF